MQSTLPPGVADDLRVAIARPDFDLLARGACRGTDVERYVPDDGEPIEEDLARCDHCEARVQCLALALRTEDPDYRFGWFGGMSPAERASLAASLDIDRGQERGRERVDKAARLRAQGWTLGAIALELDCCRRTVQRDLAGVA